MDRMPHYLRPTSGAETPSNFIVVDTETHAIQVNKTTVKNSLTFGWCAYQRKRESGHWCEPEWFRFTRVGKFWDYVCSRVRSNTRTYLFCHNGNFDLPVLQVFSQLKRRGWSLQRAVIDDPPLILKFRKGTATLEILDTLNWWREKLEKIGESVGFPKLTMPKEGAPAHLWDTYCKRDVEILRQALLRWWKLLEDYDMGGFAPTIASQAMRWWRHSHMTEQVLVHCDENALRLERASYFGGRNECWYLGDYKGKVYYLDYNSAYLSIMRDKVFPVRLLGVDYGPQASALPLLSKGFGVIAEVYVRCESPILPRLIDGKLCFPVGTFWTVVTGVEIGELLKVGEILDVGWSAAFEMKPLFRTYADQCWKLRHAAKVRKDKTESDFFKKLGNSLYGKFGQNGMKWDNDRFEPRQPDGCWIEYDYDTGQITHCRRLAGLLQRKRRDAESFESIPSIASYVCAYQRVELWSLAERCGLQNVLYLDTDGCFVTEDGYRRIKRHLDPDVLGAVKLEGVSHGMRVLGCKDYVFNGKGKTKGVREKAEWLDSNTVEQQQWSSLKGTLRAGNIEQQTIKTIRKTLTRRYTKGTLGAGNRVEPLRLAESPHQRLLPAPSRR